MKSTIAFMGITVAAKAAAIAQFFDDYSNTLAGIAATVTIVAGIHSIFKKEKR